MRSTFTSVLALLCVAVGCFLIILKESRYLKVAQGQASSDEVQWQLGMPIERSRCRPAKRCDAIKCWKSSSHIECRRQDFGAMTID